MRSPYTAPVTLDAGSAGWQFLGASIMDLTGGESAEIPADGFERVVVPLSGSVNVIRSGEAWTLSRSGVFTERAAVLYLPPGETIEIQSTIDSEVAIGSAPATGRLPARLIDPGSTSSQIRGGYSAERQVTDTYAFPTPAERLICYEVYVPRGHWSGWPPHCHDNHAGSPYLEETYYFRFDRPDGWGIHRNWHDDRSIDETFTVEDRDLVLVPGGYHTSGTCPGANMYFLNFLAGELTEENRGTPPYFHPDWKAINEDWGAGHMILPTLT